MADRIRKPLGGRASYKGSPSTPRGIGQVLWLLGYLVLPRGKRAANGGSAAVEFALTLPFLVALAVGAADYSIMANKQELLEAATRAGAEYARANPGDGPNWTNSKSYVTGYASFSPSATASASTVCTCADGTTTTCPGTTFCSSHQPTDPRVLQYASVSATQNFSALLMWSAFGFPTQLRATTMVRLQ
jgi:Flp pilus assembly protein TadG